MKSPLHQELEERFKGKKGSYILITCEEGFDGSLAVEMSYSSDDPVLASCLLSDAQAYLTDEIS
ncbi:MAG: hypothetical protein KDK62_02605 [Chlamydiia bacterium]|nr:hypothetical protein [Chlamydiia bacterium]